MKTQDGNRRAPATSKQELKTTVNVFDSENTYSDNVSLKITMW